MLEGRQSERKQRKKISKRKDQHYDERRDDDDGHLSDDDDDLIEDCAGFYFFVKDALHTLHDRCKRFSCHEYDKKSEHKFDPSERFHFQKRLYKRFGVEHRFVFGNTR